jgi:cyclopropane fatty-acyl-phospholipid synthase-like methyltransferase
MVFMSDEIKMNLKTYYDLESKGRNIGSVQEWKFKPRKEFLDMAKQENRSTLLEIGAGTGKDSKFFAENGLKVVAVDLSAEMVKLCIDKGLEAYELDFTYITSLNKTFDCVWSMNSLLHLEKSELPIVLEKIDTVLNPDGLFYMGVYGGEDKEEYKYREGFPTPRYFSFFSDEKLKNILIRQFDIVRFDIIEIEQTYHFQSVVLRKKRNA